MLNEEFTYTLARIKNPEVFFGVARILKVKLVDENFEPLDAADIIAATIDAYAAAPRKRKRELLKILRQALKENES